MRSVITMVNDTGDKITFNHPSYDIISAYKEYGYKIIDETHGTYVSEVPHSMCRSEIGCMPTNATPNFNQEHNISKKEIVTSDFDDECYKFVKGDGLFKKCVKRFKVDEIKVQNKKIKQLKYVKSYDVNKKVAVVDLKKYGLYEVKILSKPNCTRIHHGRIRSHKNPFLSISGNLCLGNVLTTYNKCYLQDNIIECLKIIVKVLSCDEDRGGYKRWSDCQ